MTLRGALAATALTLAAGPAWAQTLGGDSGPNILGDWTFVAAPVFEGCRFYGQASIRPGPEDGVYACSFVAHDVCPGRAYRARQSCVASREGDRLVIESTLEEVEPPSGNYYPDHFILTIIDGANMAGELASPPLPSTTARFYRESGPIS